MLIVCTKYIHALCILGYEAEDLNGLKIAFKRDCVIKRNIIFECAQLNRCNQWPEERADAFITVKQPS